MSATKFGTDAMLPALQLKHHRSRYVASPGTYAHGSTTGGERMITNAYPVKIFDTMAVSSIEFHVMFQEHPAVPRYSFFELGRIQQDSEIL